MAKIGVFQGVFPVIIELPGYPKPPVWAKSGVSKGSKSGQIGLNLEIRAELSCVGIASRVS